MTSVTGLKLLQAYSDSDEENDFPSDQSNTDKNESEIRDGKPDYDHFKPVDPSLSIVSKISIESAPVVLYSVSFFSTMMIINK
jgi:hypothetical protein